MQIVLENATNHLKFDSLEGDITAEVSGGSMRKLLLVFEALKNAILSSTCILLLLLRLITCSPDLSD